MEQDCSAKRRLMPIWSPSFSLGIARRGQKGSICEDCQKASFLSEKLTWGNVGRSASERLPSESRTHISAFFVPRTSFSEKKGEKKGGRQFRLWSLISHKPGRAFFFWWATISLMALDASQIENRMPCFSRKMAVGKGLAWGGASLTRGIAPGSRRDSLRDIDRAISRRVARVAFGECA